MTTTDEPAEDGGPTVPLPPLEADANHGHFVLPPRHRLFAVFDGQQAAGRALGYLASKGYKGEDVWVFSGEEGVDRVHPGVWRHGFLTALVRVFQRVMTNDGEYAEELAHDLERGGFVVAVKVPEDRAPELSRGLRRAGGHDFAYGGHWNFLPVPRAA